MKLVWMIAVLGLSLWSGTATAQPTVTSVTPNSDGVAGGDIVVIYGTNLTNVVQVNFGLVAAWPVNVTTDFSLVTAAPPESAGTVDITVVDNNGAVSPVVPAGRFTYGPPPTVPPIPARAVRPSYNTGKGFFVVGRGIYDANGNLFTPIGFDSIHWDAYKPDRFDSKANIERTGFGDPYGVDGPTTDALVQDDIMHKAVPLLTQFTDGPDSDPNTVGTSGSNDPAVLAGAVSYWASNAAVRAIYSNTAWFNIANEWGGCFDDSTLDVYLSSYRLAVVNMRNAGYLGPLVVDAGCSGQGADIIVRHGSAIEAADPQHNVIFALHVYNLYSANDCAVAAPQDCYTFGGFPLQRAISTLAQLNVPVIIAEFGCTNCLSDPDDPVTPDNVMQVGEAYQTGWISWATDDCQFQLLGSADCTGGDFFFNPTSNLPLYGQDVFLSLGFGMQAVAKPATVFQ